ncbi:Acyltransferase GLAUCE [Linum perenne]
MGYSSNTISLTEDDIVKYDPVNLVSPNHPTNPPFETIFLSNIDQAVSFPVETLFFFDHQQNDDVSEAVKGAISKALKGPYYFMTGRLRFNQWTQRLELVCTNAGSVFVSASSTFELKQLGDLSLPNPTFCRLIHRPGLYRSMEETPLMTVQVTKFACGGYSIGFAMNHGVLDGKSAGQMFESFASICRGDKLKTNHFHNDRTIFRARNPTQIQFPHHEFVKLQDFSSSFTAPHNLHPSPSIFTKKYTHKRFSFTSQMISTLKSKANSYPLKTTPSLWARPCTTFEAIVAHVWKARTKSVFHDFDRPSTVLFAVDVRSRVAPPLPEEFAGNAVVTAFATARGGSWWASRLGWRSVIDWLEVHRGVPATCGGNFYVSAWCKLPFNELDFGSGKPVHGGPVVSGNDEFVLLLSDRNGDGSGGGGVSVWLGLEEENMDKFMVNVLDL